MLSALLLALAINSSMGAQNGDLIRSQATHETACPPTDHLAGHAAAVAEAAYPGPLTEKTRSERLAYLLHHVPALFDPNNTGYLDAARYDDYGWAQVIVMVPSVRCDITLNQWLLFRFQSNERIAVMSQRAPDLLRATEYQFKTMADTNGRMSKKTFLNVFSRPSFSNIDIYHNGMAPVDRLEQMYTAKGR